MAGQLYMALKHENFPTKHIDGALYLIKRHFTIQELSAFA